jgi:hypothetical protein
MTEAWLRARWALYACIVPDPVTEPVAHV